MSITQSPETALAEEIAEHISRNDAAAFGPLALRIFAYQYAQNKPYRAYCNGRKATPDSVTDWQEIPPAPAAAFKRFELRCTEPDTYPTIPGGNVFFSSGTTGSETSRHYLSNRSLLLYELSLQESYRHFVTPDVREMPIAALMPSPETAPNSSLSYMLSKLHSPWKQFFWDQGWEQRLVTQLEGFSRPVVLFGTAFAWVMLLDHLAETKRMLALPAGSRIVETGGFKGRTREVSREELYRLFTECLGVPATYCVAEYGMSEMASQFYDTTLRDRINGVIREPRKAGLPHLVRTRVIDPLSGEEAAPGQPGVLAHYDIANLNSVLAIQTEDYGYALPDGDGFVLLGRAPGAALRGCSLTAEEFAQRQAVR